MKLGETKCDDHNMILYIEDQKSLITILLFKYYFMVLIKRITAQEQLLHPLSRLNF